MNRRIVCQGCKDKRGPQHPEDVAMGWRLRVVEIKARKPAEHAITFLSDVEPPKVQELASLFCDDCGSPIADGQVAFAITMWRGQTEPDNWEREYSGA